MFIKFHAAQQLLKLPDLLREPGEIPDYSWLYVLHLILNLQEGHNELEFVEGVSQRL